MATTPFYLQQFRFLDDSPASGGKLYAFLQGTETPAAVYLDAGLTTQAPSPIILGADGVVPQFFVPPINGYAFRLTDPRNGVETTVWTRDYVAQGTTVNGTVTSVGLNPPDLMSVTGSPIASNGTLVMEWSGESSQMVRADGSTVDESSFAKANDYLPLAGGSMAQNAQIQFPGQQNVGGFYGMYWQAPDCWSRISHWGGIWSPSLKPGERRGGILFAPDSYGASIVLRSPEGQQGVSIYTHETGGYSLYSWMPSGDARVALGVHPSGHGEAYFENSSSDTTVQITGSDGSIRARSIWTGTGQWTQVERITPEGVASFGSVRTGPDQYSMVERINGLGAGYLTSLSISGLTNGYIPRATTAGGLLADSSLSEDAVSVKSTKPLTLNGATRPAWALWDAPIQLSDLAAIYTITGSGGQVGFARNFYINNLGERIAIVSGTGVAYPSQFHVDDNGRLRFFASKTNPVAGAVVMDVDLRFEVNRFGDASLARGLGVFGVTPPTSRPTVNAACTDLATCIALTNQLRTHLIACGLVQ